MMTVVLWVRFRECKDVAWKEKVWTPCHPPIAPTCSSQLTFTPVGVFLTAIAIGGQKFEPQPMDGLAHTMCKTKMNCNITHPPGGVLNEWWGNPSQGQYTWPSALQVGRHELGGENTHGLWAVGSNWTGWSEAWWSKTGILEKEVWGKGVWMD